jgi:hypothetical protein
MSNRTEVLAAYHAYLAAFLAEDAQQLRASCVWPLTLLTDGATVMLEEFPYSPAQMKAEKRWATSQSFEIDVVGVSSTKAHLVLRNCERLTADGTLIENVTAFYAFTKTPLGWQIFALSAIEFPA